MRYKGIEKLPTLVLFIYARKGAIQLEPSFNTWITLVTQKGVSTVIPRDKDVILSQEKLPPEFSNDSSDRIIVVTALLKEYPLATKDDF